MAAERLLGNELRDVSAEKKGPDIESRYPRADHLRFIEVKGSRKHQRERSERSRAHSARATPTRYPPYARQGAAAVARAVVARRQTARHLRYAAPRPRLDASP